jgi:hypothetical protein
MRQKLSESERRILLEAERIKRRLNEMQPDGPIPVSDLTKDFGIPSGSTAEMLCRGLKASHKSTFPEGVFRCKFNPLYSPSLTITLTALPKEKWANGIINNDPFHQTIFLYGFDEEGNADIVSVESAPRYAQASWDTPKHKLPRVSKGRPETVLGQLSRVFVVAAPHVLAQSGLSEGRRITLRESADDERILNFIVDHRKVQEAFDRLDSGNDDLLDELKRELAKALGTIDTRKAEALRRFLWVVEHAGSASPDLLRNNLGKGLNALGAKTPIFF